MTTKIETGKIRCRFCNKIKTHVTMPCTCEKKINWNNPNSTRRTLRLRLERLPTPSKQFLKMLKNNRNKATIKENKKKVYLVAE